MIVSIGPVSSKACRTLALSAILVVASTTVADYGQVRQMLQAKEDNSETSVDIPDAALRQAVEDELGKATGDPITRSEMASLRSLGAGPVRQLDGIEHAVNLRELFLFGGGSGSGRCRVAGGIVVDQSATSRSTMSDVSPLEGLTALTTLQITRSMVSDISPLADLTSLTKLILFANEISDVSPLKGLTSLEELDLSWNDEISDVSPLADLTSLTDLNLAGTSVTDVSVLADITTLAFLDLGCTGARDISPLANLTALTDLNLSLNDISDISPLAGLESLTRLHLADNPIFDVSQLFDLPSLSYLDLSSTQVDISSLADLTSLTGLYLGSNGISDVSTLAELTSLTWLDLYNNAISDVSPLAELTSLTSLYLNKNPISDVSPLSSLRSLSELSLGSTRIVDLSGLANLTSLTSLYLGSNAISDVSPLVGLTLLRRIVLYNTDISNVSSLVANTGLGLGDYVNLASNPLDGDAHRTHIPALLQRGVNVVFDKEVPRIDRITDASVRRAVRRALSGFFTRPALDLTNSDVGDLTGLADAIDELYSLFLDHNRITDIAPLAELRFLEALTLSHNAVEDWTPLARMDSLYFLALDGNSLVDLPALPSGLAYLYLADNLISDITDLADMGRLEELDISGNAITSLKPLDASLTSGWLYYLHANDNEIVDLSPVVSSRLRELHVRNNAVRDISPLLTLDGTQLLMVDVRRNPLADNALAVLETLRDRRVTVLAGETVPYFPAAGQAREGFVRIVNHSDENGHVFIEAVDDGGVRVGPVRLNVGARRAVHFDSADLEDGNASKGLDGIGAPTAGDWRLSVISALDVEVLSYIRTEDGFFTTMHDVLPDAIAPFFNPASNERQRSFLRVVNTEAEPAKWTTGGYDDGGRWHPMAGSLLVRPQHALTLTAQALENEHGLGDGQGKWRLRVRGFPWFAMSLLESPTGHLTNLSTAPAHTTPLPDGTTLHRLPLFPAAGGLRKGFVRVINRSYASGEVAIQAVDDDGTRFGPVRLAMRPRQAVYFDSRDLEAGNTAKGLLGGVGVGEGDWRLELASELDLMVLSYARTTEGFLTAMHDVAPVAEDGSHRVVFFNPGSNTEQVSKLRLINDGERRVRVTITGIDDAGSGSGTVTLTVPAGSALAFTSAELETGSDRVAGGLGDGEGRWRLRVRSNEPIAVMSLLETPSGLLTNMSTGTAE